MSSNNIHIKTPLIHSTNLTKLINHDVYLKLENNQPSGSFKLRGIGYHCQKEVQRGCRHFISASGGNAGIAVATAGKVLNIPVTVYIPKSSPKLVFDNIKNLGKEVIVHGENFEEANQKAMKEGQNPGCSYIHPFTHPETWEGHSSMVDEIAEQLGGTRPGCLMVSVGGGGLLLGLLRGMERHGWTDMPIFCLETLGADCFNLSLAANKIVEKTKITSIAHTLGAKSVPQELLNTVKKFPNLISHVFTDAQTVESCIRFADDQRILVEPSCGVTLATIYTGVLQDYMAKNPLQGPVVVVVCGGTGINLSILADFAKQFNVPFPYYDKQ